jgi:hypothetical protein
MLSLFRSRAYGFQVVTYESDGTWVAYAADVEIAGFGESLDEAHKDLRSELERFAERLGGAYKVRVRRGRPSRKALQKLGKLTTVKIPNPYAPRSLGWLEWLFRKPKAQP